jgi:GH24 family phage-related lysozyme (muramidase)
LHSRLSKLSRDFPPLHTLILQAAENIRLDTAIKFALVILTTRIAPLAKMRQADLLRVDVGDAYADVQNSVAVELNPNQTAALISLRFNIGGGAFASSTLLRLVNQGDFDDAAAQFPVWIHSGGAVSQALVTRRAQEQELFTA